MRKLVITTSWDDGHPLDFRVAELLAKYGLQGTFYIPLRNERPVVNRSEIRELARSHEIGAHTLAHVDLTTIPDDQAQTEITHSKALIEEITGVECRMFCFPLGRHRPNHLPMVEAAGFAGVRTVELLSAGPPRRWGSGLEVMPTTLQAFPHTTATYLRNNIRRWALGDLLRAPIHALGRDWVALLARYLERLLAVGGCLHLWGHSWEVEEIGQWGHLEEAFRLMSHVEQHADYLTNGAICT